MNQKHCFFPCKFAEFWFAYLDTKEICGFAIYGLIITNVRIRDLGCLPLKKEPTEMNMLLTVAVIQKLKVHKHEIFFDFFL